MRKKINFLVASLLCVTGCSSSCNRQKVDETSFLQLMSQTSDEGRLGWNIAYRHALIKSNRPMGYVFELSLAQVEKQTRLGQNSFSLCVGLYMPNSVFQNSTFTLNVDGVEFKSSSFNKLRDNEYDVAFIVGYDVLASADEVKFKIDENEDLLPLEYTLVKLKERYDFNLKNKTNFNYVLMKSVRF